MCWGRRRGEWMDRLVVGLLVALIVIFVAKRWRKARIEKGLTGRSREAESNEQSGFSYNQEVRTELQTKTPLYRPSEPPELNNGKWVGWNFCGWLDIVGIEHHKADAAIAYRCAREDDYVELRRAPENQYDTNAIEVWFGPYFVGFIDRHTAATVSKVLPNDMPICGLFKNGWQGETGFIRLTILPLMPDVKTRKMNGWHVARKK
jgi:hypothetical protein